MYQSYLPPGNSIYIVHHSINLVQTVNFCKSICSLARYSKKFYVDLSITPTNGKHHELSVHGKIKSNLPLLSMYSAFFLGGGKEPYMGHIAQS